MGILRFLAIVVIFGAVSLAWMALGASVQFRTDDLDRRLSAEMASDWGPRVLAQGSPYWLSAGQDGAPRSAGLRPAATNVRAAIDHDHRYKGLLWYSTFRVDFAGQYTVAALPPGDRGEPNGTLVFPLPAGAASYDALAVELDGRAVPVSPRQIAAGRIEVPVARDANRVVTVRYATHGQDAWLYSPGEPPALPARGEEAIVPADGPLAEMPDFSLAVETSFTDIDYPKGTMFPTVRARPRPGGGLVAEWHSEHLITRKSAGVLMPRRPNAGPIAARMSFFAPVSLVFFFTVLFTVVVLKGIRLHPMHYLFVAAGFFAFHILLSYLADVVNIHAAFWISAAVSVLLVVSYMRLVAGVRFALGVTALAQLVFLVGFSYAFFWRGRTGLTVTIGAVLTLLVLMQATGRVNWFEVFSPRRGAASPDTAPPLPSPPTLAPTGMRAEPASPPQDAT